MKKIFSILIMTMALGLPVLGAFPTVTVTLYVVESTATGGAFPDTAPDTTAEITYVSSLNPNPIRYSPVASYSSATGAITWIVPQNSYFKVGCRSVIGMWPPANYSIGTSNVILNDLVSGTPPSTISSTYVPYTGSTKDLDLGSKNITTTGKGTFGTFKLSTGAAAGTYLAGDASGNGTWVAFPLYENPLTFVAPLSRTGDQISIPAASASVDGYLAKGDWSTFNKKAAENHFHSSLTDATHSDWVLIWDCGGLGGVRADEDTWTINGAFNMPFLGVYTVQKGTARDLVQVYDTGAENDTEFHLRVPALTEGAYVTITFPGVTGTLWGSGNDGTGSGLDADTLDGDHGSAFLKAEADTFQTVLDRNATSTTNPKAPRFISTQEYIPDAPVAATFPSGFPNDGTAADSKDEEFNGAVAATFAAYGGGAGPTISLTTNPGFLTFSGGSGPYYMVDLGSGGKISGDFDVTMAFKLPGYGSHIGLSVATDEATPTVYVLSQYWGGSGWYNYKSAKISGWGNLGGEVPGPAFVYYRIKRVSNEMTFYGSLDGYSWVQLSVRDISTSSNVYYLTESHPIQFWGIYFTVNGGSAIHAPAGTITSLVNWIRWK